MRLLHHLIAISMAVLLKLVPAILLMAVLPMCKQKKAKVRTLPAIQTYDLQRPYIINLHNEMNEISGLYFYAKDTSVFSINDEEGYLYKLTVTNHATIQKWHFSFPADYEDISLVDSTFYVLRSNGTITSIYFIDKNKLEATQYKPRLKGFNEFESLYYNPLQKKLVLLCKDCAIDDQNRLTAYSFDVAKNAFDAEPLYVINIKTVADLMKKKKVKFKPSAAAIHPLTGELYIVSSVNKAIVVAGQNGEVKGVYPINVKIFKQPEGMAFTPWGDLLISNEATDVGLPNILVFKYNANSHAKR